MTIVIRDLRRHGSLYAFVLPFALLTIVFGLWPIGDGIRIAFVDSATALGDTPSFVGLKNFRAVLSDPAFLASVWRTLLSPQLQSQ